MSEINEYEAFFIRNKGSAFLMSRDPDYDRLQSVNPSHGQLVEWSLNRVRYLMTTSVDDDFYLCVDELFLWMKSPYSKIFTSDIFSFLEKRMMSCDLFSLIRIAEEFCRPSISMAFTERHAFAELLYNVLSAAIASDTGRKLLPSAASLRTVLIDSIDKDTLVARAKTALVALRNGDKGDTPNAIRLTRTK